MNLLYVSNARMPTEKAHGWQIVKMCESFADAGAKVDLFVPDRRKNNPIKQDAFEHYGIKENFKIQYAWCWDLVGQSRLGFYIQVGTFTLSALVKTIFKKTDALYTRDEVFAWSMSWFKKNVFYEMHDYPRAHFWLYKGLFKRIRKIISTNQIKKDRLIKEFGVDEKKIVVQRNGVDLSAFESNKVEKVHGIFNVPSEKKIISYIGKYKTFGQSKGVENLIDVFSKLQKENNDVFLLMTIIDRYSEFEEVKNIFQKYTVPDSSYRIQTHASRDIVQGFMQLSDVLIMNYPNTEHYAQFMSPLKMFEYMASGTPIVSTDLPSIREVLNENNAVLVAPDNSEALKQGITRVLNDNDFAQRISKQAMEDVRKYDWKNRAQSLLRIMQST